MLTTIEVRSIMRKAGRDSWCIYTNKTRGHAGNERRVKCYFPDEKLVAWLNQAAGAENVKVMLHGGGHGMHDGIVVKCVLA
jgi:hypothetical protein